MKVGTHEMDFYGNEKKYFLDMDEALAYKSDLETEAREMDMK